MFVFGSAADPYYSGEHLAAAHGVVVVVIQYRLGVLGFAASPSLQSISSDGSTGNYGVQDQRLALKWVRSNAAAFGGNPDNIFVFGESAGGASVSFHLVAPRSAGLFAAAGIESGSFGPWAAATLDVAEGVFNAFLAAAQCNTSAALACALALPETAVLDAQNLLPRSVMRLPVTWSPVVDGVELTAHPRLLAAEGARRDRDRTACAAPARDVCSVPDVSLQGGSPTACQFCLARTTTRARMRTRCPSTRALRRPRRRSR
jgi:para-nitrobenzyl esterase